MIFFPTTFFKTLNFRKKKHKGKFYEDTNIWSIETAKVLNDSGETIFDVALGGRLGFFRETYNLEMYFEGIGERAIRVDEGKKLHLKLGFILIFSLVTLVVLLTMISLLFANNVANNGSVFIIIFIPRTIILSVGVCVFIGCCVHVEHNKTKYLHDHGDRVIGMVTRK